MSTSGWGENILDLNSSTTTRSKDKGRKFICAGALWQRGWPSLQEKWISFNVQLVKYEHFRSFSSSKKLRTWEQVVIVDHRHIGCCNHLAWKNRDWLSWFNFKEVKCDKIDQEGEKPANQRPCRALTAATAVDTLTHLTYTLPKDKR